MDLQIVNSFDIRFELVKEANAICVPIPYGTSKNNYYLKTRSPIALASKNCVTVPTGIRILDFPQVNLEIGNGNSITCFTQAKVLFKFENRVRDGIEIIGPQIITKDYDDELRVTLYNSSKKIFYAEEGDEIAILSFELMPSINFNLFLENQIIPKEMR